VSEARAGFNKDDMDITLENKYFPLGVHYIHENTYDGTVDDSGELLSTVSIFTVTHKQTAHDQ